MPIHDWRLVDAGIFHAFHHSWIGEIYRALNGGLLPPEYYALAERVGDDPERIAFAPDSPGGEPELYAAKAVSIVVRHQSNHRKIAIVSLVSPGDKSNRHTLGTFVERATVALQTGIHLLILDLFPPGPHDPQGIHKAIWDELIDNDFASPENKPLTLAAYSADESPEAFVEPIGVGDMLPDMPLFLTPDGYVPIPLEAAYRSAWEGFPSFWRDVLERPSQE